MIPRYYLCVSFLLLLGCGAPTQPPRAGSPTPQRSVEESVNQPAPETRVPVDLPNKDRVTVLTLQELAEAYRADQDLTQFQSATLEITDLVSRIEVNHSAIICDIGPDVTDVFTFVIDAQDQQPWARIAPGQRVTLRGRHTPTLGGFEWKIVDFGPNPAPIVTAPSLATEFIQGGVIAAQKYHKQTVYVTGEVVEKKKEEMSISYGISLKGEGRLNVLIHCPVIDDSLVNSIQVGQEIHAQGEVGTFTAFDPARNEVTLFFGKPISVPFPVKGVQYAESMASRNQERVRQVRAHSPDFKIATEELRKEIRNDVQNAKKKYTTKWVDLSGKINSFQSSEMGDSIALDSGDGQSVFCRLLECEPWKSFSPGQPITIRGRFRHFDLPLRSEECVVVSAKPLIKPLRAFTAEGMIQLCLSDRQAFAVLSSDNLLEVSGTLEAIVERHAGFRLTGADGYSIVCRFPNPFSQTIDPYRARFLKHAVGDQVRILANFDSLQEEDKAIKLIDAWELTIPQAEKSKP